MLGTGPWTGAIETRRAEANTLWVEDFRQSRSPALLLPYSHLCQHAGVSQPPQGQSTLHVRITAWRSAHGAGPGCGRQDWGEKGTRPSHGRSAPSLVAGHPWEPCEVGSESPPRLESPPKGGGGCAGMPVHSRSSESVVLPGNPTAALR